MKLLIFLVLIMPACALAQSFTKLDQVFTEEGEGGIDWGDVDGDGDLDFVVSGFDSKVYLNERGAFVKGQSLSFMDNGSPRDNLNHGNVQIADFNKDGNPDILASGWTGS
ncbi:MAG TPA: FG-GAP-like repeat-containing protein, partial [Chryseosolibacter sp.]|nr:FG-GAP-like repeat-containing protein [Chryseosolibacter sp.]